MLREISLSLPATPGKWAAVPLSDEPSERTQKRAVSQSVPQSPLSHLPGFSTSSQPGSPSRARPILRRHLVLFGAADGRSDDTAAASLIGNDAAAEAEDESATADSHSWSDGATHGDGVDEDEADEAEVSARLLMLLDSAGSTGASIEEVLRAAASCFSKRLMQHARTEGIRDSASLVALPPAVHAALAAYIARPDVVTQLDRAPSEQRAQLLELIRVKPVASSDGGACGGEGGSGRGGGHHTAAKSAATAASSSSSSGAAASTPPAALLRARAARAARSGSAARKAAIPETDGAAVTPRPAGDLIDLDDAHSGGEYGGGKLDARAQEDEEREDRDEDRDEEDSEEGEEEETFVDDGLGSLDHRQQRARTARHDHDDDTAEDEGEGSGLRPPAWAQRAQHAGRPFSLPGLAASLPSPIGAKPGSSLGPDELGWRVEDDGGATAALLRSAGAAGGGAPESAGSKRGALGSSTGSASSSTIAELEAASGVVQSGGGSADGLAKSVIAASLAPSSVEAPTLEWAGASAAGGELLEHSRGSSWAAADDEGGIHKAPWDFGSQRASPKKAGGADARARDLHSPQRSLGSTAIGFGRSVGDGSSVLSSPPISPDKSLEAQPNFVDAYGLPAHLQLPESSDEEEEMTAGGAATGGGTGGDGKASFGCLGARLGAASVSSVPFQTRAPIVAPLDEDEDSLPPWLRRR